MACPWPHKEASDYYNEAITAPPEWWRDLKVEEVLVLAGGEEVLIDGIREFAGKLSEYLPFLPFYLFNALPPSELRDISILSRMKRGMDE